MRSKSVIVPFLVSVLLAPAVFALAVALGDGKSGQPVTRIVFAGTVLIEIVALTQVLAARRLFHRGDHGYLTWSLVAAFLIVRLIAEFRLLTLTFVVTPPKPIESASSGMFFYVVVLRYLYTVSDLLFVSAMVTTARAYKSTGLKFNLLQRDYLYIALVWLMPVATYLLRDNLGLIGIAGPDKYVSTYRLVAVCVGALIVSLCLVVRRYAVQMGGGAVARVWGTVVAAGTIRAASFLTLALLSKAWPVWAPFIEQYLLWIFAGCWLMAALYQREVVPGAAVTAAVDTAGSEAPA
ncbi:MAG TPA: hypothetical protein VJH03_02335 [Blastocatellia bacterium]|nr:hypothetical protein [Blastocatellia bacterium]